MGYVTAYTKYQPRANRPIKALLYLVHRVINVSGAKDEQGGFHGFGW